MPSPRFGRRARPLIADGQNARRTCTSTTSALFPDRLYIELSRRGDAIEEAAEAALIELAYKSGLPLVATNPAAYTDPSFHAAHDAMLCIAHSAYVESAERVTSSPDAWLKDGAAMTALFADLPEAVANTSVIAQRCAIAAPQRQPILPRLSEDEDETLRRDARAGLELRLERLAKLPFVSSEVETRPSTTLGTNGAGLPNDGRA